MQAAQFSPEKILKPAAVSSHLLRYSALGRIIQWHFRSDLVQSGYSTPCVIVWQPSSTITRTGIIEFHDVEIYATVAVYPC